MMRVTVEQVIQVVILATVKNEDDSSERLDDQADFEKETNSEKARKHKDTKLVRFLTGYTL